jgi:hypothetical protein
MVNFGSIKSNGLISFSLLKTDVVRTTTEITNDRDANELIAAKRTIVIAMKTNGIAEKRQRTRIYLRSVGKPGPTH